MHSKKLKIIYWIITIIFSLFMLFGGVIDVLQTEEAKRAIQELGYPLYFLTIIGVAKILGSLALLQTKFPTLKEWAYAGFTFDILGASFSIALSGSSIGMALAPLIVLIVMAISYSLGKKVY